MDDLPQDKLPDVFTFHAVADLQEMALVDLRALWELVPTERQRVYRSIYDRTLQAEGASGADSLEQALVTQLLERYATRGLVPVGSYWVAAPNAIREAAAADVGLVRPEPDSSPPAGRLPVLFVVLAVASILIFGFLFVRNLAERRAATGLPRTATPTAPVLRTPSPTPLAFDAQDAIIRGGDADAAGLLYPVNLRIEPVDTVQPRIFIVQRKRIETTEWNYDNNPDTASYISGLIVRPVLGIPWSVANAALFDTISTGTRFTLQLNTGATVGFTFSARERVNRSETGAFLQTGPGLVLVLLGEDDAEESTRAPSRVVISADYVAYQELSRGRLTGIQFPPVETATPTLTPTPVQRLDVQLISVELLSGRVVCRLRVYNGRLDSAQLSGQSVWLAYGYVEHPVGPRVSAAIEPITLLPGQAADLTLIFAWHDEPFATLGVLEDYQFALTF